MPFKHSIQAGQRDMHVLYADLMITVAIITIENADPGLNLS